MRTFIGCIMVVVLAIAEGAGADDKKDEKIDAKKLIGKWEPKDAKKDAKIVMEFTKDGKMIVTAEKDFKVEGSYKLEGNKLRIQMKVGENELNDTVTLTKLTDSVMEGESEGKKTKETFKRVKEK